MYTYIKRMLLFVIVALSITASVTAKEVSPTSKKTALGVNPAIMEVILDESTPSAKVIQLYNLTNFPLPIKTMVESFTPNEKLNLSKKQLEIYDASSWIDIDEINKDFILQPKENRTIDLKIVQPKGASPGGHYASVIFQPLIPQAMVSDESVFIFARVATLVFMQVKGDIKENLSIKEFKVRSFYQYVPNELEVTLKNTGNTHLRPQGNIEIYDEIRRKTVGRASFRPSIILPGTEKPYSISLDSVKNLRAGRYSVKAKIVYGNNNQVIQTSKHYFILFPYLVVFVTALLIVLSSLIVIRVRTRLGKALNIIFKGE